MKVGEKIREIRKSQKLSQQQLGDRLGVSQAMIAQYENGDRNPKFETLVKIADALGVYIGKLDDSWGTDLSNPAEYEKFKSRIESFEADLGQKNEHVEQKQKIPGEIIIDITVENYEKYKKIFLLAFDRIIEKIYESYNSEIKYYNADTGEEVVLKNPNFNELTDQNKFKIFQETVKEIRYNTILNTFSITFL